MDGCPIYLAASSILYINAKKKCLCSFTKKKITSTEEAFKKQQR